MSSQRTKAFQILVSIIVLLSFLLATQEVQAEDEALKSIEMEVFIHDDGSASITEKRKATLHTGTENYIIIGNLGKSTIQDFRVEEDQQPFQYMDDWNLDAARADKAFKHGIIEKDDYFELIWGIGEYGTHEYTITYTITDMIKQLDDAQVLFWRFINDEQNLPPENVSIKITANDPITQKQASIWAFGYEGDIRFQNDAVLAQSSAPLSKQDYLTLLIKFPKHRFQTNDVLEIPFAEVQERAFEGSDYGFAREDSNDLGVYTILRVLGLLVLVIYLTNKVPGYMKRRKRRKAQKQYLGRYYRKVPYEGNILDIYTMFRLILFKDKKHFLTALLLKWMYEARIDVKRNEEEDPFSSAKNPVIHILFEETDDIDNPGEKQLFEYLLEMAGTGKEVDQTSFIIWTQTNHEKLKTWNKQMKKASAKRLAKHGYIKIVEGTRFRTEKYKLTEAGKTFAGMIYMFKNYLTDYSLLHEHEPVNVQLWDELMIWAAMLGITEEVYEQFKKLYPKYPYESMYSTESFQAMTHYSNSLASVDSAAGFGGSSSSGGGGGSFGGGSGGGTR